MLSLYQDLYTKKKILILTQNLQTKVRIYVCVRIYYIVLYTHIDINTYIRMYVHTYINTYILAYIRTCIHTYINTYIHTSTER